MKKIIQYFLVTISLTLLISCGKTPTTTEEFTWEIDLNIDGENQHWKGIETFPNAPADNWCFIDNQNGSWTLIVSSLKTVDETDWISGSDEFTMSLTWAPMNGTDISGALFVGGSIGYSGKSYLFGQDLEVNIISEGSSPDFNSNEWGDPFIVSFPSQTVQDGITGSSHDINGKITALRLY